MKKRNTNEIIRFCVQYCCDKKLITVKELDMVKKYNKHSIRW